MHKGYWVWVVTYYYYYYYASPSLSIQTTVPNGGGGGGGGGRKVVSNQPQKVFRKISTCNGSRGSPFMGVYGFNVQVSERGVKCPFVFQLKTPFFFLLSTGLCDITIPQ
jgi:hypothetical protein